MSKPDVEQLYQKWYKPVRSRLRKRNDVPKLWVEDIAQEVFIRLLKYDFQASNVIGYVFRVADNVANEWLSRVPARKPHLNLEEEHEAWGIVPSPEEVQEQQQLDHEIQQAMSRLGSRQRQALLLHIYEKMTYEDIAKKLGLTYRIVLRDLTKAYAQLRIDLDDIANIYTLKGDK